VPAFRIAVYEDAESIRAAVALGGAPDLSFEIELGWYRGAQAVRERAAQVIAEIPHPPGLSSASALSWDDGEQMSSVEGDIQLIVQLNAICDWIRHAVERRLIGDDIQPGLWEVLAALPAWPAIRRSVWSRALADAVVAARAGDPVPLQREVERCAKRASLRGLSD
jgi:hypothetical protein